MDKTYITLFGRGVNHAVGYSKNSAKLVYGNQVCNDERIDRIKKRVHIKQCTNKNGKIGSILSILDISSKEFVRYFNFYIF